MIWAGLAASAGGCGSPKVSTVFTFFGAKNFVRRNKRPKWLFGWASPGEPCALHSDIPACDHVLGVLHFGCLTV